MKCKTEQHSSQLQVVEVYIRHKPLASFRKLQLPLLLSTNWLEHLHFSSG